MKLYFLETTDEGLDYVERDVPVLPPTADVRRKLRALDKQFHLDNAQLNEKRPEVTGLDKEGGEALDPAEKQRMIAEHNEEFGELTDRILLEKAQVIIDTRRMSEEDRDCIEGPIESEFWQWQNIETLQERVSAFRKETKS